MSTKENLPVISLKETVIEPGFLPGELGIVIKSEIAPALAELLFNSESPPRQILVVVEKIELGQSDEDIGLLNEILYLKQNPQTKRVIVYLKTLERVKILNLHSKEKYLVGNYSLYSDIIIADTEKLKQTILDIQEICKYSLYIPLNNQEEEGSKKSLQEFAYNFSFYIANQISKEINFNNFLITTRDSIKRLEAIKQYCLEYLEQKTYKIEEAKCLPQELEEQIISGKLMPIITYDKYLKLLPLLDDDSVLLDRDATECFFRYLKLRGEKSSYIIYRFVDKYNKREQPLNIAALARFSDIKSERTKPSTSGYSWLNFISEKIVKIVNIQEFQGQEYAEVEEIVCAITGKEEKIKELIEQNIKLFTELYTKQDKVSDIERLPVLITEVSDFPKYATSLSFNFIKLLYYLHSFEPKAMYLLQESDLEQRFVKIKNELRSLIDQCPNLEVALSEISKSIKQVSVLPEGYIPTLLNNYLNINEILPLLESQIEFISLEKDEVIARKLIKLFYGGNKTIVLIKGKIENYSLEGSINPAVQAYINNVELEQDNDLRLNITPEKRVWPRELVLYQGLVYSRVEELIDWTLEKQEVKNKLQELTNKAIEFYLSDKEEKYIPFFNASKTPLVTYAENLSFYIFNYLYGSAYSSSEERKKLEEFYHQNILDKYNTLLQAFETRRQNKKISDANRRESQVKWDIDEVRDKTNSLLLPYELKVTALDLLNELKLVAADTADFKDRCKYINTILELPWNENREFKFDQEDFRKRIDEGFYGLARAKDRIANILRLFSFSNKRSRVISLYGRDGEDKEALAAAIATAMGRKMVPINAQFSDYYKWGGVRSKYSNASLGEVTKIIHKYRSSELVIYIKNLEVIADQNFRNLLKSSLDINTNKAFFDWYIDFPIDYSNILFILDIENKIPTELESLAEEIRLEYTTEEKIDIISNNFLPQLASELDLTTLTIKDSDLEAFIKDNKIRSLAYLKDKIKEFALANYARDSKIIEISYPPATNEGTIRENKPLATTLLTVASSIEQIETSIASLTDGSIEKDKALQELSRLKIESNSEHAAIKNYLVQLLRLPWLEESELITDFEQSEKVLQDSHFGLDQVKDRIIEFLAVVKRARTANSPILCLVGPPGVGKTSLAESIAKAVGRKYVRLALGGVSDDSVIRGHMRTYLHSAPGMVIQLMQQVGSKNPVMLLDEIDKTDSYRSKAAVESALLELLDPKQNKYFTDHYLQIPFDLSNVMFITTANSLDNISPALQDRLEIIKIDGYTEQEKLNISKRHIIPKIISDYGLENENINFTDTVLQKIIRNYTRESGVRNLERNIKTILRKILKKTMVSKENQQITLTEGNLVNYLKNSLYTYNIVEKGYIGKVTGLSYASYGGDMQYVEAIKIKGDGKIKYTGKLGEVLKESIETAYSYLKSQGTSLGVEEKEFKHYDIHVHLPEGAISKDGPSAGIAIYLAMVSVMTGRIVKPDIAMTGEIDLMGSVMKIGGLKEKLLAAQRSQIKTVIIPEGNMQDLTELPTELVQQLKIVGVKTADQILELALERGEPNT